MRYFEFAHPRPQKPLLSSGTIKPKPPLTPAQTRRRAERKTGIAQRMNDEQRRHGEKMADLRGKMSDT